MEYSPYTIAPTPDSVTNPITPNPEARASIGDRSSASSRARYDTSVLVAAIVPTATQNRLTRTATHHSLIAVPHSANAIGYIASVSSCDLNVIVYIPSVMTHHSHAMPQHAITAATIVM